MVITMVKEESTRARKGPWTEQEDTNLVFFVGLFGDRRWDAIARASGLHRTGKSCRLRWVNYLRPGLKRGRMTPHEERLIVELHSLWGNRWSRIARKLPGRTDNEIKNYWRTHTRKKVQESEKRAGSSPELSTSSSSSCLLNNEPPQQLVDAAAAGDNAEPHAAEVDGGDGSPAPTAWEVHAQMAACGGFTMEQIWDEIASSGMSGLAYCYNGEYCMDEASCCNLPCSPVASQPASWDHSSCETSSLWKIDEEEMKMLVPPLPLAGDSFAGCVL